MRAVWGASWGCPNFLNHQPTAAPLPLNHQPQPLKPSNQPTAVGVAIGAAIRIAWRWRNPRDADAYAALVGGALIAGDGVWGIGRGVLAALGIQAPICMSFSAPPSA